MDTNKEISNRENCMLDLNMVNISHELQALIGDSSASDKKVEYSSPEFELHILPSVGHLPLLSSAVNNKRLSAGKHVFNNYVGNGSRFRKSFQREPQIYFNEASIPIGLDSDGKERNLVLRLFGLFHELHYILNENLPCTYAMFSTQNICLIPPVHSYMPFSMNVQYQVKSAARRCTEFICKVEHNLNVDKLCSDLYMNSQCRKTLCNVRERLHLFQAYKHIPLEHKNGEFVSEKAQKDAENLSKIMDDLKEHIRFTAFSVYFFYWTMSKITSNQCGEGRLPTYEFQESIMQSEYHSVTHSAYRNFFFQIVREVNGERQTQEIDAS